MIFLRAHGEEQKQERVQQIIDATIKLYDEIGYDKITFSKIALYVNFSRINLYNYFSCKEDIFLLILMQEIRQMVADAEATFTGPFNDRDIFCHQWAEMLLRHQRMLSIFSITNTIILAGASDKQHKAFRQNMYADYCKLAEVAKVALPKLDEKKAIQFIDLENSFALVLYPASCEYKKANNITIFSETGYGTREFIPQFTAYLKVVLAGLLA
ncbi:TetR family transcriptional regulator [Phascolarctobacterium succinatutens]|uniref:TetR family transcriptional regulator n=1 Tax=Phascolarctobacterium succinatutens TaxID=626940 RepID=UPI0025F121D3|nr:TetR family transcriptional regulator [Phascolarctobacterium succinatutens]